MAEARWQHITIRREVDRITEKKKKVAVSEYQQGLTHINIWK